mgnify:CR=1 FL=1
MDRSAISSCSTSKEPIHCVGSLLCEAVSLASCRARACGSNDETSSESISFLNMEVAMRMMSCRLSANCLNADRVLAVLASSALSGLTESLTLYGSAWPWSSGPSDSTKTLLEGAHHLIDPAGLRGAGERHKQVSGCIGLFHLVERALSDQSGQSTGIAGLGLRVRAGGLALGQRAQGRLLLQHGDIAGRRMHHVGAVCTASVWSASKEASAITVS